jgi:hypothetical protein
MNWLGSYLIKPSGGLPISNDRSSNTLIRTLFKWTMTAPNLETPHRAGYL